MREIKFRAWDKEKGIWVSSGEIEFSISEGSVTVVPNTIEHIGDSIHDMYVSDRFAVTEYTGLKDKNGVEIYEGDILAVAHQKYLSVGDERFYRNGYANRAVKWRVTSHHNGWNIYDAPQTQFEVIGNIHENPELLEANQ